jgi:hypothetical protein
MCMKVRTKLTLLYFPCVFKHQDMYTYAGVEVYTHAFLIFTLNRNEWVSFTHQQAYQWG